ncbi:toxin [Streptomyces olivaceus]|uniref:toxin n=1 Tax=Streptomyces olivaceus TaxID=47716 RepID=UPI001CCB4A30|nr:toxin [Streptomyces olivaceus]MBZ6253655.1 toxin [Streptomyces olivaceus]
MSSRGMKSLLSALGKEAGKAIRRPADPEVVMNEFCKAMTARTGRPIQLRFRTFPLELAVSGVRLDLGESSIIVVEQRMAPEAQLVILGHELWHEENGDCGHHVAGVPAAARALAEETPESVQRAVEQILTEEEIPRDALLAVAARAESVDTHEVAAETFGLLFGREVRTWMTGRHAQSPPSAATVEGRLNLSLLPRGGRIL